MSNELKISESLRLRLVSASAETRTALAELRYAQEAIASFVRKHEEAHGLLERVSSATADYDAQSRRLKALLTEVQESLGIADLEGYAMHPETGVLKKGAHEAPVQDPY